MMKRMNCFNWMLLVIGAVMLTLFVGGMNARADSHTVDPAGAEATINIVDTKGNELRAPQKITYEDGLKNVNVTVPGYVPADTLREVDVLFNPDRTPMYKTMHFFVNDTTEKLDSRPTFVQPVSDDQFFTKEQLADNLQESITTLNDGLAKTMDQYKIGIEFYSDSEVSIPMLSQIGVPQTFTIIYDYQEATMPVEYVNDNNGSIVKRDTITGFLGQKSQYKPVLPAGYQLGSTAPINYDLASKQNATLVVHVVPIPPTPVTPSPAPSPAPQPNNNSWNPTTPKPADGKTGLPNYAEVKGDAVYAVKPIYMYSSPNFDKNDRIAKYPKRTRTNRPMFVVTGYAKSNSGALRYEVRDVNKQSKYYGKTGYITANKRYVLNVYYQTIPKNRKITVIAKKGVNAYRTASLTGKATHYKKGTRLHVKKLVKHNLTTRYQLTNGHYVTGNKQFVIQGNY
ncbi:DUF5776 domain-containing protein [Lentilactobacillus otakiensis]|uniref:DUF5776 domain-containing protein n=1 Tax=Lentilactobacillus otakiensis TaxID=481720 RepID=UPI003D166137